jgi:hypothetical protein
VCDVELQSGEQANFLHLRDTPLNSEPAVTGSAKKCPEQAAAAESTRKGIQETRTAGMVMLWKEHLEYVVQFAVSGTNIFFDAGSCCN